MIRIEQEGILCPLSPLPGYSLYGLQHAYAYPAAVADGNLQLNSLEKNQGESYATEAFGEELQNKAIQKHENNIYDIFDPSGQLYEKYKRYGMRKDKDIHWYVLEKIEKAAEPAAQAAGAPAGGEIAVDAAPAPGDSDRGADAAGD